MRCQSEIGRLFSLDLFQVVVAELPLEPFNPAGSVHQLLLSGEKGMALGADFNPNFILGAFRLNHISTRATNGRFGIVGMDFLLHLFLLA
jgi:hypothetical protein